MAQGGERGERGARQEEMGWDLDTAGHQEPLKRF